LGERVEANLIV